MAEPFEGFLNPDDYGFTRIPHDWIDVFARVKNLAELKILFYVARHTWGFGEIDQWKHITTERNSHNFVQKLCLSHVFSIHTIGKIVHTIRGASMKKKAYGWCCECSAQTYYACDRCGVYCCLRCQPGHICKVRKGERVRMSQGTMVLLASFVVGCSLIVAGLLLSRRDRHREYRHFVAAWRDYEAAYGPMEQAEALDLYFLAERDNLPEYADVPMLLSLRQAVRAGLSPEEVS